jgi:hypothetical protein
MPWDAIGSQARADLVVPTDQGGEDVFLWEHSERVARNARHIAALPEVGDPGPDPHALIAAALYHEAGWIERLRSREIRREELLIRPRSGAHLEEAAMILEHRLSALLPQESLIRAADAIRGLHDHNTASVEARIVAEADTLEQFGLLSLWLTIRRGVVDGKGVQNAIDTWRRRREFGYWRALLNDSFRFPSIRAVAERRLDELERVMAQLERQHDSADLRSDSESD